MEIHSNKCNSSLLSREGRTSLRGRDSLITKLITQWTIRKTTIKTAQDPQEAVLHQLKTATLSKRCKMQVL